MLNFKNEAKPIGEKKEKQKQQQRYNISFLLPLFFTFIVYWPKTIEKTSGEKKQNAATTTDFCHHYIEFQCFWLRLTCTQLCDAREHSLKISNIF